MGASDETSIALKAAKKSLKRQDSGSMKLKALAKVVVNKMGDDTKADVKSVKQWIIDSDKFNVDGKIVTLASSKKRPSSDDTPDKKSKKKMKKSASTVVSDDDTEQPSGFTGNISKWRKEHKIVLKSAKDNDKEAHDEINTTSVYHPYTSFQDCKEITPALIQQCTKGNGFEKPSPIQAQCWPVLLHALQGKKRDIVGIAETGSGKTLAFALPALSAMYAASKDKISKRRAPSMLVLAPTRELAMQSQVVIEEFGAVVNLRSLVVYGGVPKHTQTSELRKGNVDCIVATPGRLKDLIHDGAAKLGSIQHLVLDEADRMLDMGFEEDVRQIISECKPKEEGRQTAMFSATWPAAIQKIAGEYMIDPVRVYVGFEAIVGSNGEGAVDDSLSANKRVTQTVEVIDDRARDARLRQLLQKYQTGKKKNDRVLLFGLYKKEAERLEFQLKRDGWNCCSIHGNKNQAARTQALSEFKDGSCPLLIATDVAARGLDIPNVEVVLNYTFPLTIEDYVHRIGRTGRAGKTGISYTFFQPENKSHAGELQQVMKQAGQEVPEALMKFGSTIKKKEHKLYGNFGPKDGPMKKATKITFDNSDDEE
mmetsp:Transcript_28097/g.43066  ORF Transcript_28097/g.43066 Transcript_28097/m.43066 type:complete len:594 (+) Transcript_28097:139-1920(+)|eukprot:CAMPEP_0195287082 /NCGR_PEP_ID=MMETSP0707-20130614/4292_1 /TAXON_ID=33640 /ORGANISM="Asterionellopsis glacialis, Strain CCMP134" /LENGTH=593 /DNA_ID=CAMNT_0040346807 /DNA_START=44 /DNA_END=1825 /DNA_ORIENTATION=-